MGVPICIEAVRKGVEAVRKVPNRGGKLPIASRLKNKWSNVAGEWQGWSKGFADTGKYAWSKVRRELAKSPSVKPYDDIHHRILAQGGTRQGAGKLTAKGFFNEQYGRFIPNFIKNRRWNTINLGQPKYRGGSGIHEALHGKNPQLRLNALQRIWYGTNIYDKAVIVGTGVGLGVGAAHLQSE